MTSHDSTLLWVFFHFFGWSFLVSHEADRCLCVSQHPNASGRGSVASSLVTCCLAELPPFLHLLAGNSKSSQELCLHLRPVPTRAASAPGPLNFPYAKQNSSFPPSHLPYPTSPPVFYSLVSGINANSRCQPRNLDNILELFFLSPVLPDTSPVESPITLFHLPFHLS